MKKEVTLLYATGMSVSDVGKASKRTSSPFVNLGGSPHRGRTRFNRCERLSNCGFQVIQGPFRLHW